ncbi:hypothetical protein H311_01009, partial [Anncaliia algerae PRA109]
INLYLYMCYNKLPMIPIFTLEIMCASFSQMQNDTNLHFKNDFYSSSSSEKHNSSGNLDGYGSDYSDASTISLDESIRRIFIHKCRDLVKNEIDLNLEDGYKEQENDQKKVEKIFFLMMNYRKYFLLKVLVLVF